MSKILVRFAESALRDLEDVRRNGTLEDLGIFHRLSHMAPALHSTGHVICEPMDVAVGHRHLWITYSSMKHSDKTFMGMSTSGQNGEDAQVMWAPDAHRNVSPDGREPATDRHEGALRIRGRR